MEEPVYHEKQVKEFCALHALNNLFQKDDAFLKSELDAVCYSLAPKVWFNPHKSLLGLGNYDVNVLIAVLQNKGYQTIWFDQRKNPNCLQLSKIFGFIMNIPNDYHIGYIRLPLQRRHWIAIRKVGNCYYNLDSKLKEPLAIGQEAELISYLQQKLSHKDNQLFVVVPSDVHDWQIDSVSASCDPSSSESR
ncbi:hypothetical protein V9T40_002476 [Parthenolecanium corni]|uniref:Josephin-2 n=1 Tax=Parthenolecanium corni TaxID=536013 RepID=A0AAN9TGA7_9HEMI